MASNAELKSSQIDGRELNGPHLPVFRPHRLLRGGHLQTLGGMYVPSQGFVGPAQQHVVTLDDGDRIALHDNRPADWSRGGPTAILLHGLCGCHGSPYMLRIARKLQAAGVRTLRMDQRGWGTSQSLSKHSLHAGRSGDLRDVLGWHQQHLPHSPVALIGFSLGGNVVLKYLVEQSAEVPQGIRTGITVCPPVDLALCARSLGSGLARIYERYFIRRLMHHIQLRSHHLPRLREQLRQSTRIRSLWDFDDQLTAPLAGFTSAEDYYRLSSTHRHLDRIQVPTHLLVAQDDPLVPYTSFGAVGRLSTRLELVSCASGGHMGFLADTPHLGDRRWMDAFVVQRALAAMRAS